MVDIEKLKALAKAAPTGPWYPPDGKYCHQGMVFDCDLGSLLHYESIDTERDACVAYVAAANPSAVLELIAEIKRLREELPERAANAWRVVDAKGKRFTVYHEVFAKAIADLGLSVTPMCDIPAAGWECGRAPGHDGPCAASEVNL